MEFELSNIFWVEQVAENLVVGSLVAQHWPVSDVWCLPEEK